VTTAETTLNERRRERIGVRAVVIPILRIDLSCCSVLDVALEHPDGVSGW
jgi:hypothetical protein